MALEHAYPLDIINVRPLGSALAETPSHSLLKTDKFQLMRLVLPAGETLPTHQVVGEVSIQCLEGRATVRTPAQDCLLEAGQLVVLPPGQPHAVQAHDNTSLLVTRLLHQAPEVSGPQTQQPSL